MFDYSFVSMTSEIVVSARKRRAKTFSPQITCYCTQYTFPHRLGSGRCKGRDWAEAQSQTNSTCQTCNCFNNGVCEVAAGQESIKYCDILETYEYKL